MSSQEERNKLTDEEKFKLIQFYTENNELWVTQGITRSQKVLKQEELAEEFDRKFSIEILENALHALRANFLREHKKYQKEGQLPNKGWKFYESMLFMKNKPKTNKVAFTSEERETLTTFYQKNPSVIEPWTDRVQRPKYLTCIDSKNFRGVCQKIYRR